MKAESLLSEAVLRFRAAAAPPADPEADASLLLRDAWGITRAALLGRRGDEVPGDVAALFESRVARRLTGEPVQYILGHAQFYRDTFVVSPAVLIPRPETEVLVEAAIERLRFLSAPRLLDLGTGSGCIGLSVLRDLTSATAVAVDASEDALDVARENARRLGLGARCAFLRADWSELSAASVGAFDAILSNPPYVGAGDRLAPEVARFEPKEALFPRGADPLQSYRDILRIAPGLFAAPPVDVVPPRTPFIAFEVGRGQAADVARLLGPAGLRHGGTLADLAGIHRVVIGLPA